jgi:hypothetical protein
MISYLVNKKGLIYNNILLVKTENVFICEMDIADPVYLNIAFMLPQVLLTPDIICVTVIVFE